MSECAYIRTGSARDCCPFTEGYYVKLLSEKVTAVPREDHSLIHYYKKEQAPI